LEAFGSGCCKRALELCVTCIRDAICRVDAAVEAGTPNL
jgi:hypothetical protein